jgi:diaminohydroxyphosphoribosylaminopyrimidine deaminase / 5-amino-6-(5-phosphoribosylamino)uracil reductase
MMFSPADHTFMARALRLAERGLFTTTPNPRVGCVIVRDGEIVGEGWHERAGEAHAEVNALRAASAGARGASVYVTLEPCSHQGRTPPCVPALVEAGVKRVVAAMRDPNPAVAGEGFAQLRAAGIETAAGLMESQARELNIGFVSRMTRERPWIRMKVAASLDGKTALANGASQWITGEAARRDGHRWRARSCAVLTGVGTVRDDDPRLTVRAIETPRQPLKVLIDSKLQVATQAKLFASGQTLVFCAIEDSARVARLRACGADAVTLANAEGKVDLALMAQELARRGVNEVLVEAGLKLNGSLLRAGIIDELLIYFAPHLLGDRARGMFDLPELTDLTAKRELDIQDVRPFGRDLRVRARLV